MIPRGVASVTGQAEGLTLGNALANSDTQPREVRIESLEAIPMVNNNVVAVGAAGITPGESDDA